MRFYFYSSGDFCKELRRQIPHASQIGLGYEADPRNIHNEGSNLDRREQRFFVMPIIS